MDGCISVLVRLFFNWSLSIYSKYKLFIFSKQSLYTGVHLLQFLNAVICSLITLFFKCIKLHQILSQFSTINLAQALDINIFERDYSNLNNPIPSKDINLWYIYKVYCREQGQHLMQQKKKNSFGSTFLKKISFVELKRVICPQGYIFNKVNRVIVQKPDEVVTQNWPGR